MKQIIPKIIRVIGIITTAVLIPLSIVALFSLQGIGHGQQAIEILYITWAIVNFIAVPFMLLGFIIKYNIKIVIYFAIAHLTLSLANMILLLTNTVPGSAALLAAITLPSILYIAGFITHKQSKIS